MLGLILIASIAIRSLPLQWSPFPNNIDGLSEVRVSQDILLSGHLDFTPGSSHIDSYVVDMPILGLVISFICSTIDLDPVTSTQWITSVIGSIAVVLGFALALHMWRIHRPSVSTGIVLAFIGSFVFVTGCVWKETLGFVLLFLILFAFVKRSEPRYRLLMTIPLPFLVFTHHHTTVVAFIILTFAIALDSIRSIRSRSISKNTYADIITIAGSWLLAAAYYNYVSLPYLDYLSPGTDLYLYLAVAVLMLLTALWMSSRRAPMTKLPFGLIVPAIGLGLLVMNYYTPIFPGIPAPSALLIVPMAAYVILTAPAWLGAKLAFSDIGPSKNLLLALIFGPLSLILFGFLRANDATSHMIIYRTFDFLMPAFAILIGLGFAYMVKGREKLGMAAAASLVIILASTLPIAYSSQELFGVQNQTYEFEYDAVEWFSENGVSSYTSDQRLGEIGWRLFDIDYERGLPYDLREGITLNASSFYVLEGQWATKGAQEYPFGVVQIDQTVIDGILSTNSVVYIGGPTDNQLVLFNTGS